MTFFRYLFDLLPWRRLLFWKRDRPICPSGYKNLVEWDMSPKAWGFEDGKSQSPINVQHLPAAHSGCRVTEAMVYKGFAIGAVGPENHPCRGGSCFRACWKKLPEGKFRAANLLDDTYPAAVKCAMDCVDYILGQGRYEGWPLAPSEKQTQSDYPLRIDPRPRERN